MTAPTPPPEVEEGSIAESIPALLAAAEVAIASAVLAAYTAWLAEVALAVLGAFTAFGASVNPDAIWSTTPSWNKRVDALLKDLAGIAKRGWDDAAAQLGVSVPFNETDPLLQDTLQRTRNLLVRTPDEVYRMIIAALNAHAGDLNAQVQAVRNILDVTGTENWPARAKTVAVTEVHRAFGMGGYALAARFSGTKTWIAKEDAATRPAHRRADGQTVAIQAPYRVGGEDLMFPADPAGSASNVINCVTGSAVISAIGIHKAFRYPYTGRMLTLLGKSGRSCTVSSHHPVLTQKGWVNAISLNQGDQLVIHDNPLISLPIDPDVEAMPATAEQIYDSLMLAGVSKRVVGLPVDFYGDGPNGDIDIVFANRELVFGFDASTLEEIQKLLLAFANAPNLTGGTFDEFTFAALNPSNGIMSFADLIGTLSLSHPAPLDSLRFGVASNGDAMFSDARQESGTADSRAGSQGAGIAASQIFLDEIIEVRDVDFSGHLYTFETESGVYIADGIVSHNCRCKQQFRRRTNGR